MPYAKVNDINMYYEIRGEGEPLVLIPGRLGDTRSFSYNVPALSEYYQVITVDNRGAGKSDKTDIPYSIGMFSSDIVELLDAIKVDKAHILGVSRGGIIAQQFTLDNPDKVMSLILGCTYCGRQHGIPFENPPVSTLIPEEQATPSFEERVEGWITAHLTEEYINNNTDILEEIYLQTFTDPPDPIGVRRQIEARFTGDFYDRLPDIKAPTLVIAGDKDIMVNPENSNLLASRIPNSELVIMENLGHGFYMQAPDEFHKILLDFLRRHSQK